MNPITYTQDRALTAQQLADIFTRAGLRRPTGDLQRMALMLEHADLLMTAWDGGTLVGVARTLSDFAFSSYLSDLAVDLAYQQHGIGRELIARTKQAVGPDSMLLLLSVPTAMAYYPKVGMDVASNAFIIQRENATVTAQETAAMQAA
ncbi:MAG TPA: GNAT family N-acetyltransferase [Burkholderiaceae bacterium]